VQDGLESGRPSALPQRGLDGPFHCIGHLLRALSERHQLPAPGLDPVNELGSKSRVYTDLIHLAQSALREKNAASECQKDRQADCEQNLSLEPAHCGTFE
jgi:hypothetical protein